MKIKNIYILRYKQTNGLNGICWNGLLKKHDRHRKITKVNPCKALSE